MKLKLMLVSAAVALPSASLVAQTPEKRPTPSGVVVTTSVRPSPVSTPRPRVTPTPIIVGTRPAPTPAVAAPGFVPPASQASNLNYKGLSFSQIKSKIAEAKREMLSRPITIANVEPVGATVTYVRVAYFDYRTRKIEYIVVSKDAFLAIGSSTGALSSSGRMVYFRNVRPNGVNTPIVITDESNQAQLPLVIQYPVERGGRYIETAYYVSTHPGIVTPDVVSAGQFYVRNTIDAARDRLQKAGYFIQPRVADMAERLATVEHVDHTRFRTEFHPNIYNDIFTLYALNEGQTYRYSVSSAGAGGMVQMIPSTYRMVRARFPNAGLIPDFVIGMQNHVNACEAMLLYMQMTWNDLAAHPTVAGALATGIARPEHLMAAGYNSNPAKLAGYISRGGPAWASLIPRETKIYLQIYDSLESAVRQLPRTR